MNASQSSTVWWLQNGSYGEKEKSRESKAKDTMVETKGDKLSRSVQTRSDQDSGRQGWIVLWYCAIDDVVFS